jgi:thiol-disulfide isomerase/thioredoxin
MTLAKTSLLSAAPEGYGIKGAYAPELEIDYWIDAHGDSSSFKLADHEDKWVFLKCFQNWCPGCHSHGLPAVKKISEAMADNDKIVFAGIQTTFEGHGFNTVDKVRDIQLQYDLKMSMGHDPGKNNGGRPKTMTAYRTGGTPWMILISPDRQVVYNDFGINADSAIDFLQKVTV